MFQQIYSSTATTTGCTFSRISSLTNRVLNKDNGYKEVRMINFMNTYQQLFPLKQILYTSVSTGNYRLTLLMN